IEFYPVDSAIQPSNNRAQHMNVRVMGKVPAWGLTFQLPQQTVVIRIAGQVYIFYQLIYEKNQVHAELVLFRGRDLVQLQDCIVLFLSHPLPTQCVNLNGEYIACQNPVWACQQGLQCYGCFHWQHRTCGTGISQCDYHFAMQTGSSID
ncbi:unnamed protein product, partial [Pocillopora meandrina]